MKQDKVEKEKTRQQEKAYHKGFEQIANILIENNITLNMVIKNLEIRPTKENVKDIFRAIAKSKYGVESTSDLKSNQIDPCWEDLQKAISESTGVYIEFPNRESTINYESTN